MGGVVNGVDVGVAGGISSRMWPEGVVEGVASFITLCLERAYWDGSFLDHHRHPSIEKLDAHLETQVSPTRRLGDGLMKTSTWHVQIAREIMLFGVYAAIILDF